MPQHIGLAFDLLLLAALGAVMYRAWRLSQQFDKLQADRAAFEQLIQALNTAAGRAENAIEGLRDAVTQSAEDVQAKLNAARALSDELEIMVQAGDSLAERLQALAETTRRAASPGTEDDAAQEAPRRSKTETAPRSR